MKQESSNKFEKEIREEQEERKRLEMEHKKNREDFNAKKSLFNK